MFFNLKFKTLYFIIFLCIFFLIDATPSDEEKDLWNQIDAVMKKAPKLLKKLNAYKGCEEEIRKVFFFFLLSFFFVV